MLQNEFFDLKTKKISIVIPVFNEEENIRELYQRLNATLFDFGDNAEIIFINDGSRDGSIRLITEVRQFDKRIKLINFSRNFGHQAAITAGLDFSQGDAVILMDADLQDPPELIPKMIELWNQGSEVVYTVRQKNKNEPFSKKITSFFFYRVFKRFAQFDVPADSGDFCLLDKKVVNELKALPERNRYLRGLRSWVGFKQTALFHERPERFAGEAKYNLIKSARLAINGITAFSSFPLQLSIYIGLITCLASVLYLIYAVARYLFGETVQGWTSLIVIILFIGGIQLILLGVIGLYIARIYEESKRRPIYIVREFLD